MRRLVLLTTAAMVAVMAPQPAQALDEVNTKKLRDGVTVGGILAHERVLHAPAAGDLQRRRDEQQRPLRRLDVIDAPLPQHDVAGRRLQCSGDQSQQRRTAARRRTDDRRVRRARRASGRF